MTTAKNGLSAKTLERTLGFGRVRMRHVSDASGASLLPFVCDMIAPEAVVLTDGWDGYNGLPKLEYTRKAIVLSSSGDSAHVSIAGRASSREPAETVDSRNPPGINRACPPAILPGRIHVPFQPATVQEPGPCLPKAS